MLTTREKQTFDTRALLAKVPQIQNAALCVYVRIQHMEAEESGSRENTGGDLYGMPQAQFDQTDSEHFPKTQSGAAGGVIEGNKIQYRRVDNSEITPRFSH